MRKGHWNARRNPKSKLRSFCPNVGIGVPFAAHNVKSDSLRSVIIRTGTTETSAPVSTRNLFFDLRSVTNKRRTRTSGEPAAESTPAFSFPRYSENCPSNHRVKNTFLPLDRNAYDTSSICVLSESVSFEFC